MGVDPNRMWVKVKGRVQVYAEALVVVVRTSGEVLPGKMSIHVKPCRSRRRVQTLHVN